MPRPPGIIDRVNYVVESFNNPCEAPWAVYVETALPAALDALIAVVCFDIGDVLRFVFRPATTRSSRHIGRKKKGQHGRKPKGIRAKLAAKLPAFERLQQRKLSQGVRTLWVIDGIGQRLLWWWLVADVASGFLYNWTSMVYKSEACQMALSPGYALRENVDQLFAAIQIWPDVGYIDLDYQKGNVGAEAFSFGAGSGEFHVVASVSVENTTNQDTDAELRINLSTPGGQEIATSGPVGMGPFGGGELVVSIFQKGPFGGGIEIQISHGFVKATGGCLYIQGMPKEQMPPVRFTCDIPFT